MRTFGVEEHKFILENGTMGMGPNPFDLSIINDFVQAQLQGLNGTSTMSGGAAVWFVTTWTYFGAYIIDLLSASTLGPVFR